MARWHTGTLVRKQRWHASTLACKPRWHVDNGGTEARDSANLKR